MKPILFFILFFFAGYNVVKAYDIAKIRKDYVAAVKDSKKSEELYSYLSAIKNPDAIILAYLGSAEAIRAKHSWNPYHKMSFLNEGFKKLDAAVEKDPNQLEVRFLRFTLQHYVPDFLGHSKNIAQDKNKIINLLKNKNTGSLGAEKDLINNMIHFMIESKECNAHEITSLKKLSV
ncbi:MAG: hypothetical protein ABIP95_16660 [Pelobium sp.]